MKQNSISIIISVAKLVFADTSAEQRGRLHKARTARRELKGVGVGPFFRRMQCQ